MRQRFIRLTTIVLILAFALASVGFMRPIGAATLADWEKVGSSWVYYGENGRRVTGWQQIGGKWFYFNSSGIMQTGWQQIGGKWYYFNGNGDMATGWKSVGGKWYYLDPSNGDMKTGWLQLGDDWYYCDASGTALTGWQTVGDKQYFFDASGCMAANAWVDGLYLKADGQIASGWEQIAFLPWSGGVPQCFSDGPNWTVRLLRCDEKKGDVWFLAKRSSPLHPALYRLDRRGRITELTDPAFWASEIQFSADGKRFTARLSTAALPPRTVEGDAYKYACRETAAPEEASTDRPMPFSVCIANDGFDLYALLSYPRGFDASKRYPVVMQVYGGPGTPYVRDYWGSRDATDRWCYENGFVYLVADPRSSGENGDRGLREAYLRMTVPEMGDYLAWAAWLRAQPWCSGRIGVEGFSFGGTSTAMLVLRHPEAFCCGIAGGGVYDWTLYDSHYTERYMRTPEENPDGYREASVLSYIGALQPSAVGRLLLTHGTGDDNVHLQNTLLLADALQRAGIAFDLMLYPDALHGYRGAQKAHADSTRAAFWRNHLL